MAKVQIRRIRHNRYQVPDWVHQQVYLNPYPNELMLRNHVSVQALSTANCRDSHGCAPLQNDRDQLIFELPAHRSRVRTLTTSLVQLLRGRFVSISPAIGTTPRLATCLKLQIRLQCMRPNSTLDHVAQSRHMNPYPLGG